MRDIKTFLNKYKYILIGLFLFIIIVHKCENKEPKIKIETKYKYIKDTIIKTVISKPKTVYVTKEKTINKTDTLIITKEPKKASIKANLYMSNLVSNNAKADLEITTTGELINVSGVIEYPKEIITKTVTKETAKSGLFVYGSMPINTNVVESEIGLMYQFKNTVGVMGGVQYDNITKGANIKVGILVKLY